MLQKSQLLDSAPHLIPPAHTDKRLVPYSIGYEFDAVAAGDTSTTSPAINVGPFAFVCTEISFDFETSDDVTGLIRDEGKSQQLTRDRVHLRALYDNDTGKWVLPVPWRFDTFTAIYMEIVNGHATLAVTLNVVFIGYLEQPIGEGGVI